MSALPIISSARGRALAAEDAAHAFAQRHAVSFLRISLGGVFVLFGALKFFPNLSPAQAIAEETTEKLTFGLVPAGTLLLVVAFVEVAVGLLLIANRAMRFALWLLAAEMIAILSPIVLLSGELFSGPHHLPSLMGQYILKDFVLLGAVLVLFAVQRGSITPNEPSQGGRKPERRGADVSRAYGVVYGDDDARRGLATALRMGAVREPAAALPRRRGVDAGARPRARR